ncbi:MAG: sigma factor, partial [Planctomyces sp.]
MLDLLRDESRPEGWQDFTARYWPVLCGFALKLGLSEADAADAAQQTLADFLREFREGRYVRERGRLSSFILGIARNRVLRLRTEARRRSRRIIDQAANIDDTPDDQ